MAPVFGHIGIKIEEKKSNLHGEGKDVLALPPNGVKPAMLLTSISLRMDMLKKKITEPPFSADVCWTNRVKRSLLKQ